MFTILITGATGFLGRQVLDRLIDAEINIISVQRRSALLTKKHTSNSKLEIVNDIDILNGRHVDFMVHLATDYGRGAAGSDSIIQANVFLPLEILERITKSPNFCLFLANSFYSKFCVKRRSCSYTKSKLLLNEFVSLKYPWMHILDGRIEHMYGENDNPVKFIPSLLEKLIFGTDINLTACEHKRDFVHVCDVAETIARICEPGLQLPKGVTTFDLGTGVSNSFRKFIETAHSMIGSKSKLNFGALKYESDLIMESHANVDFATKYWVPKLNLDDGIRAMLMKSSL